MYRGFECTVSVRRVYRGFDVCTGGPTCVPGVRRVYRGFECKVAVRRVYRGFDVCTGVLNVQCVSDVCTGGSTCVPGF